MPRQSRATKRSTLANLPTGRHESAASLPPVLDAETWQHIVKAVGLSEKQAQVVALIMRGLGDKQIGRTLGIQYGTVRIYRERAVDRLGLEGANGAEITTRIFELAWATLKHEPCPSCQRVR